MGQSARHIEGAEPTEEQKQMLLDKCLAQYPQTTQNQILGSMDLPKLRVQLSEMLDHDVVKDANPGFPLAKFWTTNRAVIENLGKEFIIDVTIGRLILLLLEDCSTNTPVQLIQKGLCDPIRGFVKNEPHPPRKVTTKRWRVISSVSVVDQLIDRLLHTTQNKVEIALWRCLPSAPGIGLSSDEDGVRLVNKINRMSQNGPVALSDVQGFDWSVQGWEILLDAEARCLLQDANPINRKLIMGRAHCICRSVWTTPNGTLYAQTFLGVVKSGTFNTSSTNSRIRVFLAWLVGALWAVAMGDDCLEDPVPDAKQKYAKYGHPLKMYEIDDEIEFCSHLFDRKTGAYKPVDPTKSLFSLLVKIENGDIDLQSLHSFLHHVRHHPQRAIYTDAITKITSDPLVAQMIADATR